MFESYLILLCLNWLSSSNQINSIPQNTPDIAATYGIINPKQNTVETRFNTPMGYARVVAESESYTYFLRHIALKPHGSSVYLYNGVKKNNQVQEAVLTFDVGSKDLQQCADAVMRIRAEYLFSQKKFDQIHFNFTNGFNASYSKWIEGYRIKLNGNTCTWLLQKEPDTSYATFRSYLEFVYNYAGTLSLSKELIAVKNIHLIHPGDVWIIGGSPGHAVTVMDVAINRYGKKIFMLAQGYMPAQDIHILKNENNPDSSPWYNEDDIHEVLNTPEYVFHSNNLMRFAEN